MTKPITLLAIVADNRMIGVDEGFSLPFTFATGTAWIFHILSGSDGTHTKSMKHSFVFGRRVYEDFVSYGIMPLGGGVNAVISGTLTRKGGVPSPLPASSEPDTQEHPKIVGVGSVKQALDIATQRETSISHAGEQCLVLGGERIYSETITKASFLRIFHMRTEFKGDIFFPEYEASEWTPFWKSKTKAELNEVDGKFIDCQIIDYVRTTEAQRSDLAPVIKSMITVNNAFTSAELNK